MDPILNRITHYLGELPLYLVLVKYHRENWWSTCQLRGIYTSPEAFLEKCAEIQRELLRKTYYGAILIQVIKVNSNQNLHLDLLSIINSIGNNPDKNAGMDEKSIGKAKVVYEDYFNLDEISKELVEQPAKKIRTS